MRTKAQTENRRGYQIGASLVFVVVLTSVVSVAAYATIPGIIGSLSAAAPLASEDGPAERGSGSLQINHQGVVAANGQRCNGDSDFRFALVDPDTGNSLWTNDGSNVPGPGMPTAAVVLPVIDGLFSVRLGDTNLGGMTAIPATVFDDDNLVLRIWFDDGTHGIQQLAPDHVLTSSPYAVHARNAVFAGAAGDADTLDGMHAADILAIQPPIGSIMAWHKSLTGTPPLPGGWVECNGQTLVDPQSPYNGQVVPDLNTASAYAGGRFLRGGTASGVMQEGTAHFNDSVDSFVPKGYQWVVNSDRQQEIMSGQMNGGGTSKGSNNRRYDFSRPVNMSVVWIMRVK